MAAERISHYRVVRRLGVGGMGEVYLAHDTELEREVALKVMSAELARDANQRKRFRTEAKAASALAHPNICVIHEVGETADGRPFLAMEYIAGQTLEVILQQRRLGIREVINLGIEVADALEAAHSLLIVHRDIKPSNIMLDQRGRVKVLDFGLAKRLGRDELSSMTTAPALTQSGVLLGTPHYMSPEQALGRELDHRTDLFSLGVVLYELVAGQRPFLGRTVGETINNVVNQPPQPLGLQNPLFSSALQNIVFRCLEKEPAQRYPSAKALADDLTQLRAQTDRLTAAQDRTVLTPASALSAAPAGEPASTGPAKSPSKRPTNRAVVLSAATVAAIVIAGGALLWRSKNWSGAGVSGSKGVAATAAPNSVAVLPFDNFSGEPDTDYLSDGLTEEITTALSRIHGLKVAARNSAFTFKGKKEDARKMGAALRVSTLLEGSIRKAGRQIRVSAQLINVADGFHLWSETYDRSVDDIFAVQEDIARRIAERLQGQSGGVSQPRHAMDPEAHKLYLQARQFWNKRTEPALRRAAQLFQEAIDQDPTYAEAHAGLAATYLVLPGYSLSARSSQYRPLARASANRALELDPGCAEAHAVLALLQEEARDWKGAEEHFRRAIQLAPNYATAHHWYGRFLNFHGRREEGLKELQTALDLDPLSPIIQTTIPEWYYLGRDFDRAIVEARKVIDAFPDFPAARSGLIPAQLGKGQFKEALVEIDKVRALQPEEPLAQLDARGYALARMGQEAEAKKILLLLEEQRQQGKPLDVAIGFVYLGLRDYDKVLEALERTEATEGLDDEILSEPLIDELRELPRFQALLKKAGLTQ